MKVLELNTNQIKKIQQIEIKLLLEVDKICKENNINYSLIGGTLIGAIRHKGFIPWDDDIDIMMTRNNYDKFCKLIESKNYDDFYLVNAYSTKYCGCTFSKIMAKNTIMREISISRNQAPCGVFIDIFPIDYASNDKFEREKDFKIAKRIKRNLYCREGYYYEQKGLKYFLFLLNGFVLKLIPKRYFLKKFDKLLKKYKDTNYIISYSGTYPLEKETHNSSVFTNYISVEFEGHYVSAIESFDEFLKDTYGDYMKLPPKDQQIAHHYIVDLKI